jgi:hypothetical protein
MPVDPEVEACERAHVDHAQSVRFTRLERKSRVLVEAYCACYGGWVTP